MNLTEAYAALSAQIAGAAPPTNAVSSLADLARRMKEAHAYHLRPEPGCDWCIASMLELHELVDVPVVPEPSSADRAAAMAILGYDPSDTGELHCDHCDRVENAEDLTTDWNPETGCHLSCEASLPCDDCHWIGGHDPAVEH